MVRNVVRSASILVAACCLAGLAGPVVAAASPHTTTAPRITTAPRAGYFWSANQRFYNYNSRDPVISIANPVTGRYTVAFAQLGVISGGMVQVTPYNSKATCAVERWRPEFLNFFVFVACYTLSGQPANALFDVIVTQPSAPPPGTFDYSLVYLSGRSGRLTGKFQFNSSHKANSVRHLGKGRYQVTFGGPRSSGTHGTVKVSAFGLGGGDCAVSGWHGSSAGQVINVSCYSVSGALINRKFVVTYANRTNLIGVNGFGGIKLFPTVNALISSTGRVQTQYNNVRHAHVTVTHTKSGVYLVRMNGTTQNVSGGDVQVSPVTSSKAHCVVQVWLGDSKGTTATVVCFDSHGKPVNSAFTLQFVEAIVPA